VGVTEEGASMFDEFDEFDEKINRRIEYSFSSGRNRAAT
jgi:hypothetical protein